MLDQDTIHQQQKLLAQHRQTLGYLLQQQAALTTAYTPPHIVAGIAEARKHIQDIKATFQEWGIAIDDHPDDVAPLDNLPESQDEGAPGQTYTSIKHFRPPSGELSPFVVGPPISHPRSFFGRERELRRLFNLWRRAPLQNAAIIGARRSGKTSLLMYLQQITIAPNEQLRQNQRNNWLAEQEKLRWIFVDFQDPRMGNRTALLHHILDGLDLAHPQPCNLRTFIHTVSYNVTTPTIILMDEIGTALHRYPELDNSFWEGLRSLSNHQVQGNLAFVLATHEPLEQLTQNNNLGSPFFNIFGYTAILEPLTLEEAHQLITSSHIPFQDTDVEWIIQQSQCWPILLQTLCRERLLALEYGDLNNEWQEEGLRQMKPFTYLLNKP